MNEVTTTGNNLPANPADLLSGLANMRAVADIDETGKGQFMSLNKQGAFLYGIDKIAVEEGSLWAVNPHSFVHGYQAWGDGELLGEKIAGMTEAPIVKTRLPVYEYDHPEVKISGEGDQEGELVPLRVVADWKPFRGFQLVCTDGEDEGEHCFISGTSLGLKRAFEKLTGALEAHLKKDTSTPVAIIELKADSYDHKRYGEIFFPVFEVIEWVDMEATKVPDLESEGDEDAPEPSENTETTSDDPAPAKTRARKATKKAEPEPTTQRRTRRRRGTAA